MTNSTKNTLSQEQEGAGCKSCKCGCPQHGDGLADLAIKALSHILPNLLSTLGAKAGEVIGTAGLKFAKKKFPHLLENEKQNGEGISGETTRPSTKIQKTKEHKPHTGTRMRTDEVKMGVLAKQQINGKEYISNKEGISSFSTDSRVIPAPPKKRGKGSNLPGAGSTLPGAGVFLPGDATPLPKKRGPGRPRKNIVV